MIQYIRYCKVCKKAFDYGEDDVCAECKKKMACKMKCQKCKEEFLEKQIDEHHKHPKFMDNPKGHGMKIPLCKGCHDFLHKIMLSWLWKFVPEDKKQECINYVKRRTEEWAN